MKTTLPCEETSSDVVRQLFHLNQPRPSPLLHYKMVNVSFLTASVLGACRPRSQTPCPTSSGTRAPPLHQWSRAEWAGPQWFHRLWSCWTLTDRLRRDDRWRRQRRMRTFTNLDSENKPAQVSPKWDMKGLFVWQETAIAWNGDHTLTVTVWHPKWFWCVSEGSWGWACSRVLIRCRHVFFVCSHHTSCCWCSTGFLSLFPCSSLSFSLNWRVWLKAVKDYFSL